MDFRLISLILLIHISGSLTLDCLSVTSEDVCALSESPVQLRCSYSNFKIKTVFWFSQKQSTNWRKNDEPEDLTLDSDYSGRVKQEVLKDRSTLTISDLRERDSGEYQLMFIMKDGVKHLSSVAVNLTVPVLQVRMNPTDPRDQSIKLTCDFSCTAGAEYYYWMKDGKYYRSTVSRDIFVSPSTEAGRYSCDLDTNLKHRSSTVCISKSGCWDVSYSSRRVCALMGSTVDISSTYSHPSGYTVNKTFWHYVQPGDFSDLREELQFAGRVEYEGNTLRIKELKMNDSGEYKFRIITDTAEGKYSGSPGVMLTVTDTTVISSPNIISEGQEVILSCSTKCTLNNNHIYIWYKNGRLVTDGFTKANKLYLDSVSNEDLQEYSCAVEGRAALCVSLNLNVQKVKNMNSRLLPLILLLLHNTGFVTLDRFSVSCSQKNICAVKEFQETLTCYFSNINNIKTVFWVSQKQSSNWRKNDEPEDLTLDSDYSGRVKQEVLKDRSTLTISDLRERDSGEYQLMFIMKDGVKHLSSVAVNLTVTVLQVRMNPTDPRDQSIKLTCDFSCTSRAGNYYWMKDGTYLRYTWSNNILVSPSTEAGRYSCALDINLKHRSSSVCISKSGCWDVSYSSRRVCALMGSTVDISSTYSHPSGYTVDKTFWHYVQPGDFSDLREELQFAGRVEYEGNTLRIKELKMNDSGEYKFRIITDTAEGKYSGSPGVILTVTDMTVISSPNIISEGQEVILICSTKCTLNNNHTYFWFKNGRLVTDGFTKANKLYLDSVSNEDLQEYSCAVEGREESTALRNTAVVLCVFLTLAFIGVLWYRRRRCALSKTHRVEKEEVLYDSVHDNAVSSDLTQKADAENQDIQYSSISFKTKDASSIPTALCEKYTTETEDVHYSTVMFK
ncbi:uncharacterized protein LOC130103471 [Rhinichthys klamathensis goyatoka]|uniref:uncharacterized protein LOC130103471 n=1 Tax=Rhinichthys klamathensis goyatoka TaxID=3034132 RepID=UPI0024B57EB5|nr:uncharacterized protein LOC130103471 [Rhinichthys klamathensis goyatoka]